VRKFCSVAISLFLLFSCTSSQAAVPYDFSVWDWPYQCHGDADGLKNGLFRVSTIDADIVRAAYPSAYLDAKYNPAADIDRNFKVDEADGVILTQWMNMTNVPADCGKKLAFDSISLQCLLSNKANSIRWIWRIYTDYIPMPGDEDHPGMFSLYYSIDAGQTWQYIATVLQQTSYDWFVPQELAGNCLLKIADDEHSGLTDTVAVNISQCQSVLDGDFNNDCYVNLLDMAIVGQYWSDECTSENNLCGGADFDSSTTVDFLDLLFFVENWSHCANPCDSACIE
jgi:hypothetical protein